MNFNINVKVNGSLDVFHHSDDETKAQLKSISAGLVILTKKSNIIINKENQQMSTAAELLNKVEEQTTVVAGIEVTIADLREDIANIPSIPPEAQAAIDAAFIKLTGNTERLANAMVAGTIVAPPEPPPEPPPIVEPPIV